MSSRRKVTTRTTLVLEALKRRDDFMTVEQIATVIGERNDKVQMTLWHLKKFCVVDSIESGDRLWFFPTLDSDKRTKHLDERTPESRPRASRRPKRRIEPAQT